MIFNRDANLDGFRAWKKVLIPAKRRKYACNITRRLHRDEKSSSYRWKRRYLQLAAYTRLINDGYCRERVSISEKCQGDCVDHDRCGCSALINTRILGKPWEGMHHREDARVKIAAGELTS